MVSEIDTGPRLYVPREAKPSAVPTRNVPAERPYGGDICYFLVFGLVAVGIIGALFGSAFSLLIPPRDKTVLAEVVSPASEQTVSTVTDTANPGDPLGTTDASASTVVAPEGISDTPEPVPPPHLNATPAAAKFTDFPDKPPRSTSDSSNSNSSRTDAQPASRSRRSAHHSYPPATQMDKQQTWSAATDRLHRPTFSHVTPTLTPPRTGVINAIDKHTTPVRPPRQSLYNP